MSTEPDYKALLLELIDSTNSYYDALDAGELMDEEHPAKQRYNKAFSAGCEALGLEAP